MVRVYIIDRKRPFRFNRFFEYPANFNITHTQVETVIGGEPVIIGVYILGSAGIRGYSIAVFVVQGVTARVDRGGIRSRSERKSPSAGQTKIRGKFPVGICMIGKCKIQAIPPVIGKWKLLSQVQ